MDAARKMNLWNEKGKVVTAKTLGGNVPSGDHRKWVRETAESRHLWTPALAEAAPGRQHDPSSGESLVPSIRVLGAGPLSPAQLCSGAHRTEPLRVWDCAGRAVWHHSRC